MFEDKDTLQRLAESGNPLAAFNLGKMLEEEGNLEEAKNWYVLAAEKGHLGGIFRLGKLYSKLGDKENAKIWLSKAAEKGHKQAQEMLKSL